MEIFYFKRTSLIHEILILYLISNSNFNPFFYLNKKLKYSTSFPRNKERILGPIGLFFSFFHMDIPALLLCWKSSIIFVLYIKPTQFELFRYISIIITSRMYSFFLFFCCCTWLYQLLIWGHLNLHLLSNIIVWIT